MTFFIFLNPGNALFSESCLICSQAQPSILGLFFFFLH